MKKENKKYNIISFSLASLTILSAIILSSNLVSADDYYVDDFSINVPVSCSLLSTIDTAHTAEVPNGTYQDDIGQTTIKAYCNDTNGFSIYAIGYTGQEYGNNTLVGTAVNTNTISAGTAVSGQTSNWAMRLEAVSGTYTPTITNSFNSYHTVPDTYTKVATYASATDIGEAMNSANGSSIHTTYAAYISYTQPADTYAGKVKYTLVHPNDADAPLQPQVATSGCINYFPNGSGLVGTMGCQEITSSDTSATLLASNFSRSGYGFAGWSDAFDYATNANAHFYGPQEDITFTAGQYTGTNDGLALYAVWVKSEGSIQDTTKVASVCNRLTTAPIDGTANLASVSALTDQRDNQTYAIAKLADDKCWMIENLRLESTAAHNSDGTLAQGYGTSATYGNFSGLATAESTGFSNTYTANSLYYSGAQEGTASIDIDTTNYPAYRMPRYNNTNTSARASSPTSNGGAMYSYGNYYTWHAAIADLTYNGTNNSSVTNTSLCPAGWHLPKGGNKSNEANNDFWSLVVTGINGGTNPANYSSSTQPYYTGTSEAGPVSAKLRSYPNNFLYSGNFYTSSANGRSSYSYYWSSTANTNSSSYNLTLGSSYVYPGIYGNYKYYGGSIRCTASAGS